MNAFTQSAEIGADARGFFRGCRAGQKFEMVDVAGKHWAVEISDDAKRPSYAYPATSDIRVATVTVREL